MKKTNGNIKKLTVIGMTVIIAMLSAAFSGCGCQRDGENTATIDEISTTAVEQATVETLNDTDQAIVDEGLTVDKDGNITDKNGKKVEVSEDGKVEIKTEDGKTVKVDAYKIKDANENNERVQKVNATVNNGSSKNNTGSNKNSSSSNNNAGSNKNSNSSSNKNNNSNSKPQSSNSSSNTNKNNSSNNNSSSSKTDTKNDSSSSNSSSSNSSSSGKQESSKTEETKHTHSWTDITKQVKVIDKEASSYEEPVYEYSYADLCWGCNADVGAMTSKERAEHMKQHKLNGEETGYRYEEIKTQVGTKTVNVPEESHYETKTIGRKCSSCGKTEYY